jgi:hypothetical protein
MRASHSPHPIRSGFQSAGQAYTLDKSAPLADNLVASRIVDPRVAICNFTVRYSDNMAVQVGSLDSSDIQVNGPGGFAQLATFVSVDTNSDGTPRTATYRITPPGGTWDTADNGTYTFDRNAKQLCRQLLDLAGLVFGGHDRSLPLCG